MEEKEYFNLFTGEIRKESEIEITDDWNLFCGNERGIEDRDGKRFVKFMQCQWNCLSGLKHLLELEAFPALQGKHVKSDNVPIFNFCPYCGLKRQD